MLFKGSNNLVQIYRSFSITGNYGRRSFSKYGISSEHFEFRHFRPHYLDVDTIFADLRRECLHQRVGRYTIFRNAQPSVVSGYGKRSINLNKVVATFEKHIFLSQTDLTRTGIISNSYNEMFEA
jgi:hypothetical protein